MRSNAIEPLPSCFAVQRANIEAMNALFITLYELRMEHDDASGMCVAKLRLQHKQTSLRR